MKPTFHHRPVNGPFEDPAVYVRVLRERIAYLFDAGDIGRLAFRDLMKLGHVFITHMHIDHFIGFDMIVRALLRREQPIVFYGPEGIIDRIEGRLRGYTWNLVSEYPLTVKVLEITEKGISFATFRAGDMFRRSDVSIADHQSYLLDNEFLSVSAVILDHDIPVLGYSLKEKAHININKAKLRERGMSVGPWLGKLKESIRRENYQDMIDSGKGSYLVSELEDIYTVSEGQKVSYIMDSAPSISNINKIVEFVDRADSLYIESYFMHRDLEHAKDRKHLTARISGEIARDASVANLNLLHISPRYKECSDDLYREAEESFRR